MSAGGAMFITGVVLALCAVIPAGIVIGAEEGDPFKTLSWWASVILTTLSAAAFIASPWITVIES